jgi:hypothetical protein
MNDHLPTCDPDPVRDDLRQGDEMPQVPCRADVPATKADAIAVVDDVLDGEQFDDLAIWRVL